MNTLTFCFGLASGLILGILFYKIYHFIAKRTIVDLSQKILSDAQHEKERLLAMCNAEITQNEQKIHADQKMHEIKLRKLDVQKTAVERKEKELLQKSNQLTLLEKELNTRSTMAKQELLAHVEKECERELLTRYKMYEEKAEQKAKDLLIDCMQRQHITCGHDVIDINSSEIKAKLIGKQAINYHTFCAYSGVDLIITDTNALLSCFDVEKREVAKMALKMLIRDGRITPQRIRQALDDAKNDLATIHTNIGLDAVRQCHIALPHPELITMIGKMALRTTRSQNLLTHSIEVSQLMSVASVELGLDSSLARRIGLLHDIGKVVPQSTTTHALCGKEIALQYGEAEEVANGIGCHHGEIAPKTPEAMLCMPCDALSACRMGARDDDNAHYHRQMQMYEEIAMECPGVEKVHVFQGGKELFVISSHKEYSELYAKKLSALLCEKIRTVSSHEHIHVTVVPAAGADVALTMNDLF